jgi:hypothetical protein
MELSWNAAEEQMITEAITEGFSRIEAVRRLRSSWRIGETPPPMWPAERPKPNSTTPVAETKRRGGRPRKHLTSAIRQREYRGRLKTLRNHLVSY